MNAWVHPPVRAKSDGRACVVCSQKLVFRTYASTHLFTPFWRAYDACKPTCKRCPMHAGHLPAYGVHHALGLQVPTCADTCIHAYTRMRAHIHTCLHTSVSLIHTCMRTYTHGHAQAIGSSACQVTSVPCVMSIVMRVCVHQGLRMDTC